MSFHVSTRLDDIFLHATFDTDLAALYRARTWKEARLGEVVIVHEGKQFTVEEFEMMVDRKPKPEWGYQTGDRRLNENRKASRRRLLKAGKIAFGTGGAIDCTVRNRSPTGAALEVASPIGIRESFTLVIDDDQQKHMNCRVVWRKENRIGVQFIGS
jgi:PilZ domain